MHYRRLGKTGIKVSVLCLGTMQWGWTVDTKNAMTIMDFFIENGGNFLDTADIYSNWVPGNPGGVAEEIIGQWMQERKNRDTIILTTKVRHPLQKNINAEGLSRKYILRAVEASLRRLKTDYIDLYLAHTFDAETPIEETLYAFDSLWRDGKVLYFGASNYPSWRFLEALWYADKYRTVRFDVLQPLYNLVNRNGFEPDLKELCMKYNIGVTPYSPLASGFLTGKYTRGTVVSSVRAASVARRYNDEASWNILEHVKQIALSNNCAPAAVALAWLLQQETIVSAVVGANSCEQLKESLSALTLELSNEHRLLLG